MVRLVSAPVSASIELAVMLTSAAPMSVLEMSLGPGDVLVEVTVILYGQGLGGIGCGQVGVVSSLACSNRNGTTLVQGEGGSTQGGNRCIGGCIANCQPGGCRGFARERVGASIEAGVAKGIKGDGLWNFGNR